jgi:(E)-4-hydroxy-3-methylbut-2-enyl-diphosphate synthase
MIIERRKTREISVGKVKIGGNNPILVQSMTNTKTEDIKSTVNQIKALENAGCEIIRVSTPNEESSSAIKEIKHAIKIPLISDVHFNYKLAISSLENGADCVRINPGNLGGLNKFKEVINACKDLNKSMRIGVNSGSLEKELLNKYGHPTPMALVESASSYVKFCEGNDFFNFKLSLKSSNVLDTIESYKEISKICDYPLHIGLTEAGTVKTGSIRSAVGLGIILSEGIGDTIRVSLSGDPVNEIHTAFEILKSLNLRKKGVSIISCPTCSRCDINIEKIAQELEETLKYSTKNITIAVMGCVVNGPGEGKEADIGIAGGKGEALFFKKGEIIKKIKENEIIETILSEVENYL